VPRVAVWVAVMGTNGGMALQCGPPGPAVPFGVTAIRRSKSHKTSPITFDTLTSRAYHFPLNCMDWEKLFIS
jgi:hypothetical protein